MTLFEIAIPAIALLISFGGAALLRREALKIDTRKREHPHR
jgi:hypothetical protein